MACDAIPQEITDQPDTSSEKDQADSGPTGTITEAIYFGDSERQKTRKGTGERAGTIEKSETGLHFALSIPPKMQ